jgi:hypothetical protein
VVHSARRFLRASGLVTLFAVCLALSWSWLSGASLAADFPGTVREEWYSLSFRGGKIGYGYDIVRPGTDGGFLISSGLALKLRSGDREKSLTAAEEAVFDREARLESFTFLQATEQETLGVSGRVVKGDLEVTIDPARGRKSSLIVRGRPVPVTTLGFVVGALGPAEGKRFTLTGLVEPSAETLTVTVSVGKLETVDIGGGPVQAYRVEMDEGGVGGTVWMLPDGTTLKERTPEGLESVKVSREEALSFGSGLVSLEGFIRSFSVTPEERSHRGSGPLTMTVGGLTPGFPVPDDGFQKIMARETYRDGNGREREKVILLLPRKGYGAGNVFLPPAPVKAGIKASDYLRDSPFLQIGEAGIKEMAGRLTYGVDGVLPRAEAIMKWVHDKLGLTLSDSFTATEVLRKREGECQAHALLMTALCRAAGVPARVVAGLVLPPGERDYAYHAWVEVLRDGAWYPMDPTSGTVPSLGPYVKLLDDGLTGTWRLMGIVNQVTLIVDRDPPGTRRLQ